MLWSNIPKPEKKKTMFEAPKLRPPRRTRSHRPPERCPASLSLLAGLIAPDGRGGQRHRPHLPEPQGGRGALGARISGDDETKVGLLVGGFFFPKSAENDGRQGLIKMLVGGMKVT